MNNKSQRAACNWSKEKAHVPRNTQGGCNSAWKSTALRVDCPREAQTTGGPPFLVKDGTDPLARWCVGSPIEGSAIVTLLRAAALRCGEDPSSVALHSLRAGGATALWQMTQNMHLVQRVGRWKSLAVDAYFWESHELARGLSRLMQSAPAELHAAALSRFG